MNLSPRQEVTVTIGPTFFQWLEQMYAEDFNGAVILHFGSGIPRKIQPLKNDDEIVLDIPSRRKR